MNSNPLSTASLASQQRPVISSGLGRSPKLKSQMIRPRERLQSKWWSRFPKNRKRIAWWT